MWRVKIEIKCSNTSLFHSSNAQKNPKCYSSFSQMKSYCTLFSRILYYFFTRLFKLFFFFFLCLSFCPIFSLSSIFFFSSALPFFSVLSLFSIARKKEIAWVEHGVAWGWQRGANLGLGVLGVAWVDGLRTDLGVGLLNVGLGVTHLSFTFLVKP